MELLTAHLPLPGKGLGMYALDYTAASSADFIMNLAKLHVFLKASAPQLKCEPAH